MTAHARMPVSVQPFAQFMSGTPERPARTLHYEMIVLAENCSSYRQIYLKWSGGGSTLALRDAAKPFGDYWRDLEFANLIDALDSWAGKQRL